VPTQETDQARWFAEEVQPHETDLRAYLRRQFPNVTDVDDLVQDSFVRLLRARETRPVACVRAYLFTIARNASYALLRRPRIFSPIPITDPAVLRIVERDGDVVEQISTRQEIAFLLAGIDTLPARCREIFMLRKLRGVSQKEIARRLGLSEQTVQVQIARGAKKCAQYLRRHGITSRRRSEPRAHDYAAQA
jgi:RNA polymerase sigma factor (sigma-70 family)